MTDAQMQALKQGRERAARQRRREAIARVKAFKTWMLTREGPMPAVPRDSDYRVFKGVTG
jgi:hypothetical protein